MSDDISKTLIPTPAITFNPVDKCIYCGATDVKLTDEHIVPKSLNGTMKLPASSCQACANITSRFERRVSKSMYGNLRVKLGYKSYRKRPDKLQISYAAEGGLNTTDLDVVDFPSIYLVANFPRPGILTGAPLSDMSPKIKLFVVGDPKELDYASSLIGSEISIEHLFFWRDLFLLLAKIAHGFLVASVGFDGYEPFLPDLILGKSPFLSHYIGGIAEGEGITGGIAEGEGITMPSHQVTLLLFEEADVIYLAVNIHLLDGVRMPTYQVVAGKVTDLEQILSNVHNSGE